MQRQSFPLRSGETCALDNETLTFGERQIPLVDIVSAGLVADTTVAVPPGMPPTPGVSLRLRDGSALAGTPAEPLDCWRLLAALGAARPGTVGPLPPPPGGTGYGPGYGPSFATGYGPQNPYPSFAPGYPPGYPPSYPQQGPQYGPPEGDKTLAGFCHLSVFFAPVILPLVVWLAVKRTQPYASQQAKQAFFFHLFFSILSVGAVLGLQVIMFSTMFSGVGSGAAPDPASFNTPVFPLALVGVYGVLGVLGLINAIFSVIAAVQAFQGKPYRYPLLGWVKY